MSPVPGRQQGQHFLVTGAGTGIGRAIAQRLAAEGAAITLLGRRRAPLEQTASLLEGGGGSGAFVAPADIRDAEAVHAAVAAGAQALGPYRGGVANAGVGGPNEPGAGDRFADLVQTNLVGTYSTLRAVQAHLQPASTGTRSLVATASVLGRFGVPGYTGYCASKTGVIGLVRALALELASQQIQVNAICPGWVSTEMAWQGIDGFAEATGRTREEAHREAMGAVPLGRMSSPEEIAGMVAWLVSADARGVTGQGLDMNGGSWMG